MPTCCYVGNKPKTPKEKEIKKEDGEMNDEPKPRPLHRTNSIFLRNLLPSITRQEIESVRLLYLP